MSCMNWYPRWELQGPCFALSIEEYEWSGGEGGRRHELSRLYKHMKCVLAKPPQVIREDIFVPFKREVRVFF